MPDMLQGQSSRARRGSQIMGAVQGASREVFQGRFGFRIPVGIRTKAPLLPHDLKNL